MRIPSNPFKRALAEGRPQIGLWSSLCSNIVAEILASSGFDWIVLDTEHSPNELPMVLQQLQAMQIDANTASPVVRPAWNDPVLIKRFLDIGSPNLILPFIQDETEAADAVSATRYPPRGIRGVSGIQRASRYGLVEDYLHSAEQELGLILQVETMAAVQRIPEIAKLDGVDGIFIGPADLSADVGHLGNPGHPEAQAAIMKALQLCKAAGKPAGILAPNEDDAKRYLDAGFVFVAVGIDQMLLARQSREIAARFRKYVGG
ncbi:aldolase/citrate lyase family protein [Ferrovibrio sp.]|uniref:HpcH/HpaI aldolase family protein n=1 Tax=Ferrovibrio sp. TaxID=1917215 RepID=UPI0025BBC2D9|nr:aldolase/citrate lyase family protein [Ferrovibrio sp.]MBX3454719.1 2-dehydro-3-deoxyglucarate aldolase [Ferrovibrio sp.]